MLKPLFLFFCFALAFSACAENSNTKKIAPFKSGDTAFIGSDNERIFIAKDEESLHRLARAATSKSEDLFNELILDGKIVAINKRTKVRIIEFGAATEVEILEGNYQGQFFWVIKEMLKS